MSRPCEDISERWWGVPQTYPSYVDEALIVDVVCGQQPCPEPGGVRRPRRELLPGLGQPRRRALGWSPSTGRQGNS